jgi:Spy/CpxP family protein refolding chaperone
MRSIMNSQARLGRRGPSPATACGAHIRRATTVVALAGLFGGAAAAWGQHGHGGSHEEGHRAAQACATEAEQVVGTGRGFGMAFAADQNGYPGPMHVLELKDRLKLSVEQEAKMQHLMHAMFTESKPKSARLLEAEATLRRLFAEGTADDAAVRAAVEAVERARRDVRLVHLLTHLKTRDLLTEEQRRIYHEARWSGR